MQYNTNEKQEYLILYKKDENLSEKKWSFIMLLNRESSFPMDEFSDILMKFDLITIELKYQFPDYEASSKKVVSIKYNTFAGKNILDCKFLINKYYF